MPEFLEETPIALASRLGPYRKKDYFALPEEPRCELVYGRLLAMTAPRLLHQRTVFALARHLHTYAQTTGGEAFLSPVDVVLADHSVVQPDVVYVTAENRARLDDLIDLVPDLLVEVVSPTGARRDRVIKLRLYAESGVREYWIVDPREKTLEAFLQQDGAFRAAPVAGPVYQSAALAGLELDLEALWRAIEPPR